MFTSVYFKRQPLFYARDSTEISFIHISNVFIGFVYTFILLLIYGFHYRITSKYWTMDLPSIKPYFRLEKKKGFAVQFFAVLFDLMIYSQHFQRPPTPWGRGSRAPHFVLLLFLHSIFNLPRRPQGVVGCGKKTTPARENVLLLVTAHCAHINLIAKAPREK